MSQLIEVMKECRWKFFAPLATLWAYFSLHLCVCHGCKGSKCSCIQRIWRLGLSLNLANPPFLLRRRLCNPSWSNQIAAHCRSLLMAKPTLPLDSHIIVYVRKASIVQRVIYNWQSLWRENTAVTILCPSLSKKAWCPNSHLLTSPAKFSPEGQ